jgi:hypothetical protein
MDHADRREESRNGGAGADGLEDVAALQNDRFSAQGIGRDDSDGGLGVLQNLDFDLLADQCAQSVGCEEMIADAEETCEKIDGTEGSNLMSSQGRPGIHQALRPREARARGKKSGIERTN